MIRVVLRDGSEVTMAEWQKIYNLPIGSDQIGRHFFLSESRFQTDLDIYGELVVNELLMTVLDAFREAVDKPIKLNSFNRNQEHQNKLKEEGFKTAQYSPHVVKLAADIDTASDDQTIVWVKVLKQIMDISGINIRIGYRQYMEAKQTFIHVDVCPEYYAPGKPYHNHFHPAPWEKVITW